MELTVLQFLFSTKFSRFQFHWHSIQETIGPIVRTLGNQHFYFPLAIFLQRRPATTIQQGGTDSRATSNSETFCNRSQDMLPIPAMQGVAADPSEASVMRAASLGLWTQGILEDAVSMILIRFWLNIFILIIMIIIYYYYYYYYYS